MQAVKQTTQSTYTNTILAETNPHKRLIRLAEVMNLTGLCRATVYHYIKLGGFPAPAKFGKSSLWEYTEIQTWIKQRLQERTHKAS
ncbi:transcriptional regulator [Gammaproteobacteria bacterium ESL0073]|nr:transcriptional regulator [Gammaproteobacteria bacterium ESL0073]